MVEVHAKHSTPALFLRSSADSRIQTIKVLMMLFKRRFFSVLIGSMVCLGCSPKQQAVKVHKEDIPILPSPIANTYIIGAAKPKDLLVRQQVVDLPWDESLSGAAAKIGLDFADNPTLASARWAATQAGYPYLVEKIVMGRVSASQAPDGLVDALAAQIPKRGHLGLARVRRGSDDVWVALIGSGGTRLPALQRSYALNDEIRLELRGLTWALLSPSGAVYSGAQNIDLPLSEKGEWWLEIKNRGEIVSSIPLYVELIDPPTNLFSDFTIYHESPQQVEERVRQEVNNLRAQEGLESLRNDGALRTLGIGPLEDEKKRDLDKALSSMTSLGYPEDLSYQGVCVDERVGTCLDSLTWDINARRILLHPDVNLMGVYSEVRTDRITIVVTLSHM